MPGRHDRTNVPQWVVEIPPRRGPPPRIDHRYPSPQLEDSSPPELVRALIAAGAALPDVTVRRTRLSVEGDALVLADDQARGKPEGFLRGREFAIVRDDGSVQLNPTPEIGQVLLDRGYATVNPIARYMAGALPPQSLILYAPRDDQELALAFRLLGLVHGHAVGRIGELILPDSGW